MSHFSGLVVLTDKENVLEELNPVLAIKDLITADNSFPKVLKYWDT